MDNLVLPYGLILLGLLLLGAEIFLPTGGILFVLALGSLVVGVAMVFAHDAQHDTRWGMATVVSLAVLIPVLGSLLLHYWPKTAIGRRFFLSGPEEDATVANMPVHLELEQLRGRYGKTVSSLRPSGIVDFDGRRVDTMSEGDMIPPGQWVRCIDVKAGKVVVRPVDHPPDLETMGEKDFG